MFSHVPEHVGRLAKVLSAGMIYDRSRDVAAKLANPNSTGTQEMCIIWLSGENLICEMGMKLLATTRTAINHGRRTGVGRRR